MAENSKKKVSAKAAPKASKAKRKTLTKKELDEFKTLLLHVRARLTGDMKQITDESLRMNPQDASGDLSKMPLNMADIGSDTFEQDLSISLIQNEQVLLEEVNEALQRIEDKSYGICVATGEAITKARLTAKPWAKYCIDYQREQERGKRGA